MTDRVRDMIWIAPARPSIGRVLRAVSEKHAITRDDIKGPSRCRKFMPARKEAAYCLRRDIGMSLGRIGMILGGRDHSSVVHLIRRHSVETGAPYILPADMQRHAQRNGLEAT